MSYRKWSRIRLPVRPIAPLGGGAAGCFGAQGDDNNKEGRVNSAFKTHSWAESVGFGVESDKDYVGKRPFFSPKQNKNPNIKVALRNFTTGLLTNKKTELEIVVWKN